MSNDKCFICKSSDHKNYECPKEEKDWEIYNFDIDEFMCSRCGRWCHTIENCNAKTDIYGFNLSKKRKRKNTI